MQGYRADNRRLRWITYLTGWLLALQAVSALAQSTGAGSELVMYLPRTGYEQIGERSPNVVYYTTLNELVDQLAQTAPRPYHLMIRQQGNPGWAALRRVRPAHSLTVQLVDSLFSDSLLTVLGTWPTLTKLEIIGDMAAPSSFTLVTSASGKTTTFGRPMTTWGKLPTTGWSALTNLTEVALRRDIDMPQAIAALHDLPALTTLTIQLFPMDDRQNAPPSLARLSRLHKLTLDGITRHYVSVFRGLTGLTELVITNPNVPDLNAALPYLTALQTLNVSCGQPETVRLQRLPALRQLYLRNSRIWGRPNPAKPETPVSLDSALAGLTTLRRLTLERVKLTALPTCLLANRSLTVLDVPDADLTTLPANFDELAALEELSLDNNPLTRLPDSVCRLPRLRKLSASQCALATLPDNLGDLTQLTYLTVNANQLTRLPASVGRLMNLRQLNVSMNQLPTLPDELGQLPHLETIAAFWNQLARLPAQLPQVRELYLTDNQLTSLSPSLGTWRHLRTLLIDNNPLARLPDSIGQLDSLEILVLGNNGLNALPETIGNLRRLRQLTIGANQLRHLPPRLADLTALTQLTITDNPIEQLPELVGNWAQLRSLTLRLPQLTRLPATVGRWQHLESLSIDSDRLLVLPDELTQCAQLTSLRVTGKRLIGLPETIGRLARLQLLAVIGQADSLTEQPLGQVVALPASLVNCSRLTDLTVQNHRQIDVGDTFQLATRLLELDRLALINCGITDLTGTPWKQLTVSTLNLAKNHISQLPTAVLDMPRLHQANFSETNLPMPLNVVFMTREGLKQAMTSRRE